MNMLLDEAVAIRMKSLQGIHVQEHILKQAMRVIDVAGNLHQARRMHDTFVVEPINVVQRERLNMILAYRLALACGKFTDWSTT